MFRFFVHCIYVCLDYDSSSTLFVANKFFDVTRSFFANCFTEFLNLYLFYLVYFSLMGIKKGNIRFLMRVIFHAVNVL